MAEIGLAASIIQLLQIGEDVITRAYKYGKAVTNAEKDLERIRNELKDLNSILTKLKDLATRPENSGQPLTLWSSLDLLKANGPLSQYESALKRLDEQLAPVDGHLAKWKMRMQWPNKAKEVGKIIETITQQKRYFMEAIVIDHA
jgi:uncharacterized phage infection (PIP) family protein YhgE